MKLKSVTKFPNQMVVVFNDLGLQVPELQGWIGDVADVLGRYLSFEQMNKLKYQPDCQLELGDEERVKG